MRVLVAVLAILGFELCANAEPWYPFGYPRFEGVCRSLARAHDCARVIEALQLQDLPEDSVTRRGPSLRIRVSHGVVELDDGPPEPDGVRYLYREFLPELQTHVVSVVKYEGMEALLVGAASGKKTYIHAPPIVSPDRKRFVTVSMSPAEFQPNAIQIWRLSPDGPKLEWELHPVLWSPLTAAWLGSHCVVVEQADVPGPTGKLSKFVLRSGGWVELPVSKTPIAR